MMCMACHCKPCRCKLCSNCHSKPCHCPPCNSCYPLPKNAPCVTCHSLPCQCQCKPCDKCQHLPCVCPPGPCTIMESHPKPKNCHALCHETFRCSSPCSAGFRRNKGDEDSEGSSEDEDEQGNTRKSKKHSKKSSKGPKNSSYKPLTPEEINFLNYIKEVMLAESNIESAKRDLVMKDGFNVEDCFRLFEEGANGLLNDEDLCFGYNLLGLSLHPNQAKELINRFDSKDEGVIKYGDFFDIVVPFDETYRNKMTDHENIHSNDDIENRSLNLFPEDTRNYIKTVLELVKNCENMANKMKKQLGPLLLKGAGKIISAIGGQKGYIDADDLVNYLKKTGYYTDNLDAMLLFIRLDKNKNQQITEDEIVKEFTAV